LKIFKRTISIIIILSILTSLTFIDHIRIQNEIVNSNKPIPFLDRDINLTNENRIIILVDWFDFIEHLSYGYIRLYNIETQFSSMIVLIFDGNESNVYPQNYDGLNLSEDQWFANSQGNFIPSLNDSNFFMHRFTMPLEENNNPTIISFFYPFSANRSESFDTGFSDNIKKFQIVLYRIGTNHTSFNLVIDNGIVHNLPYNYGQIQLYRLIFSLVLLMIVILFYILQYWWFLTSEKDKLMIRSISEDLYPTKYKRNLKK
jgi:hypothetical protein